MESLTSEIHLDANCGIDLASNRSLPVEALYGLRSYHLLREAGCQVDGTGDYCFAQAVTDLNYLSIFYLPLGVAFNGTPKHCDHCLASTMATFKKHFEDNGLESVRDDFHEMVLRVQQHCGSHFISQSTMSFRTVMLSSKVPFVFSLGIVLASIW